MEFIIYSIFNKVSRKHYIGSTWVKNSKGRLKEHFGELGRNTHHSPKLQNSWNKHGKEAFEHFVIEKNEGNKEFRFSRESFWIKVFNSYKNGYNCTEECNGAGHPTSDEVKSRLSLIMKEGYKNGTRFPPNKKGEKRDPILMQEINSRKRVPIIQLTLEGDFIKNWEGAVDAYKDLKLSRTALGNALNKRSKSCGGFKWKYKNHD